MSKLRVIIADDIFTNRLLLSEIIEDLGHTFFAVENGKQAVDTLLKNDIDLVLMDIEMPVMNGLEATKYIRESLPSPKCYTPVVH
jgi:two-component system sensor histidine kinase RpfC